MALRQVHPLVVLAAGGRGYQAARAIRRRMEGEGLGDAVFVVWVDTDRTTLGTAGDPGRLSPQEVFLLEALDLRVLADHIERRRLPIPVDPEVLRAVGRPHRGAAMQPQVGYLAVYMLNERIRSRLREIRRHIHAPDFREAIYRKGLQLMDLTYVVVVASVRGSIGRGAWKLLYETARQAFEDRDVYMAFLLADVQTRDAQRADALCYAELHEIYSRFRVDPDGLPDYIHFVFQEGTDGEWVVAQTEAELIETLAGHIAGLATTPAGHQLIAVIRNEDPTLQDPDPLSGLEPLFCSPGYAEIALPRTRWIRETARIRAEAVVRRALSQRRRTALWRRIPIEELDADVLLSRIDPGFSRDAIAQMVAPMVSAFRRGKAPLTEARWVLSEGTARIREDLKRRGEALASAWLNRLNGVLREAVEAIDGRGSLRPVLRRLLRRLARLEAELHRRWQEEVRRAAEKREEIEQLEMRVQQAVMASSTPTVRKFLFLRIRRASTPLWVQSLGEAYVGKLAEAAEAAVERSGIALEVVRSLKREVERKMRHVVRDRRMWRAALRILRDAPSSYTNPTTRRFVRSFPTRREDIDFIYQALLRSHRALDPETLAETLVGLAEETLRGLRDAPFGDLLRRMDASELKAWLEDAVRRSSPRVPVEAAWRMGRPDRHGSDVMFVQMPPSAAWLEPLIRDAARGRALTVVRGPEEDRIVFLVWRVAMPPTMMRAFSDWQQAWNQHPRKSELFSHTGMPVDERLERLATLRCLPAGERSP